MSKLPKVFISYRRDESTGFAGRLHERLTSLYGTESVFMDVDDIGAGADFVKTIEDQIASCNVLLVLIGNQCLTLKSGNGVRRLDDPHDFVRIEISKALAGNVRVIPLLVNNAKMPVEKDVPADIRGLCRRQAIELTEERWEYDFGRLVEALSGESSQRKSRRKLMLLAGGIAVLAAAGGVLWFREGAPPVTGKWAATVTYDFLPAQPETFVFEQMDDQIRGSASFLGVERTILEGTIQDDRISFITRTREFSGADTRDSVNHYAGTVKGPEIQFVMQTIGGFSDHPPVKFTARRVE